jgi:hypothetical protein
MVHAGDPVCVAEVNPRVAPGGSAFVFSGSGFTPTRMTLQKEGDEPINHDLSVGTADPWEVTVRSRVGDEGKWSASFTDSAMGCTGIVEFRVTLSNTDVLDQDKTFAGGNGATVPDTLALYLAVVVFGFAGGMMLGKLLQARVQA